ncbi:MAG: repeat unit transporter, partial [Herbinix sp.]|nr:repeat unit transporter [Herbinix sp.]
MLKGKLQKIPLGVRVAIVYTVASVFSRGLSMITVPIFTRIMSKSEIGVVNLYNSWYILINVVATLSLTSGGFQSAMKEFEGERDQYQSSVLTLTSIMALLLAGLYFICPGIWNDFIGLPKELMILMFFAFFFLPAQDFWLLRQRYEYKYKFAAVLTMGTALVATVVSIIVVLKLINIGSNRIAEGRVYATNAISISVAAILWIYLYVKGKVVVNLRYWKYSLRLSIPLIGYGFASQILNVSDRMMISNLVGNDAVGIYSTLYTVSSISLLVWAAINASFIPYLYENIGKKENKIREVSISLMGTYAIIAVILAFFAPEIIKILATEEYYEAIYIMPPIAAGVFLTSVSNMYSNLLIYYKSTKYIMYSSAVAAVMNVALNYVFIKAFGYMAAAYTTLISYIILAGGQALFARKVQVKEKEEAYIYNDKAVCLMAVVTIAASLFGLLLYQYTVIRYIITVTGGVVG